MLNSFLTNFFGFNKQQRSGLLVLVAISLFLLVVRLVYPLFIKPDAIVLLNLPLIERKLDSSYKTSYASSKTKFYKEESTLHLFVFDPNTVSAEQLSQLGLKEKTVAIFLKFRTKGFIFREKSDLKKVFGISEKLYAQLEPYILIAEKENKQSSFSREKTEEKTQVSKSLVTTVAKQTQLKLELNSVDSLQLISVNGIGPGYAKRILKFRSMLGGFVSVEQLKEVYGLSEEVYEKINRNFYVDARSIRKINLNKDDFKIINKHPYLTYELTKSIFDWRRKTSINPTNLKDILNDPILYNKLLPYLVFE